MEGLVHLVAIAPQGSQDNIIQGGGHWSDAGYGQGNLSRLIFDMAMVGVLSTRFEGATGADGKRSRIERAFLASRKL